MAVSFMFCRTHLTSGGRHVTNSSIDNNNSSSSTELVDEMVAGTTALLTPAHQSFDEPSVCTALIQHCSLLNLDGQSELSVYSVRQGHQGGPSVCCGTLWHQRWRPHCLSTF